MNVHVAYISLLVLSFGFIAYLKLELDGLEEGYSKENVVLQRRHSGLVEVENKLKTELLKCHNDRDTLKNNLGSESRSLEDSLNHHKTLLDRCEREKVV